MTITASGIKSCVLALGIVLACVISTDARPSVGAPVPQEARH